MAERDIDFVFEIGSLRNVQRAWQQVLTSKVENISEHTFRTTMIAWIIATAEGADTSKVIKMALLHDICESRTGDIAFMHREYVMRHEELAESHIFKDTAFEKEVLAFLHEYAERKTLEAKIVKDADNLEVDFELKEMANFGDKTAMDFQKQTRPPIREQKIYTETAKRMWDDLQKTDANAWHNALTNAWATNKQSAK